MSCIRFNTPAQREAMRLHAPVQLSPDEVKALHPAPPVTQSKINRLRLLAESENPKIRASVASSYHAPDELYVALANDPDEEVRSWVARNETVSCDILRTLADDPSEKVRGFLAINFFVPSDVMEQLSTDDSETVRRLVQWKTQLAEA
ncbi:hypothetical protein BH11ACT2_BH11ACT2_13090 [soil metagenome]